MRHFMYSRTQHKEQKKVAESINKEFKIGRVYIGGSHKPYTEILSGDIPISWYPDAMLVLSTSEDISTINYSDATYE